MTLYLFQLHSELTSFPITNCGLVLKSDHWKFTSSSGQHGTTKLSSFNAPYCKGTLSFDDKNQ